MNSSSLRDLSRTVQENCDIADAQHDVSYSLCVYLMKMREYFRWERSLPFAAKLAREDVGEWLMAREQYWESLEHRDFRQLTIDGKAFDPFDADAINLALRPHELVYSSGLGHAARPHFFLAELEDREVLDGFVIYTAGRELARDLASPPAMLREQTIFLRREALKRLLWEKYEGWRFSSADNAMGRALACYDFENDIEGALDSMARNEMRHIRFHELGEFQASKILGEQWNELLVGLSRSRAEMVARAVRDHLADALSTLPEILEQADAASIHAFFGNMTPMRKQLWPALLNGYERWLQDRDTASLGQLVEEGRAHWLSVAQGIMDLMLSGEPLDRDRVASIETSAIL